MKPGKGSKAKGSKFEREICTKISLWISDGKSEDWLWRSSNSGGRATVARRSGRSIKPAGDICSIDPAGYIFTDRWFVECKHVKDLQIDSFLLTQTGPLWNFWQVCRRQARQHKREPMIIAKQNRLPIIVVTRSNCFGSLENATCHPISYGNIEIRLFDQMMETQYNYVVRIK